MFSMGERKVRPGEKLTEAEVRAIPRANLNSLRDSGYLQIYPKQDVAIAAELAPIVTTRFAIHRGCGKYDVIEGVKLNENILTKAEAEVLVAEGIQASN